MPLFADAMTGTDLGLVALAVINAATLWITKRFDTKVTGLERDLKGCQEEHATAKRSSAEALVRVADLEKQNGGQQELIDSLTTRMVSLVSGLQSHGLPAGSGPLPALPDQTNEHSHLPPKD